MKSLLLQSIVLSLILIACSESSSEDLEPVTDNDTPTSEVTTMDPTTDNDTPTPEVIEAPTKITFEANVKSIISQNCFECHNGPSARAGVRLENFQQIMTSGASVLRRMNDANNPMPPSGLLRPELRNIINQWASDGFLEQ